MTWLLDGNVLLALQVDSHVHHDRAHLWFAQLSAGEMFATCAITQGSLLRLHTKVAKDPSVKAAWAALTSITGHVRHVWWGDDLSYEKVPYHHLQGGSQVTDAWLAQLARKQGGRLATMDQGLVALHGDVAMLLPA